MRKQFSFILSAIIFLFFSSLACAENLSTEMALFEEIPMVVTPGKKLQPITQSPASVYVITQEDIKQSGSINLWDVLREVPGMDVSTSTIGQPDVSMRGFNDPLANKTLLLVDGRSVYGPLQGFLLWEAIPVQLEEVDRIEVVKGPVASLYGANANLGLINIITKKPEQMKGSLLSLTGGSRDTERFSYMYGDKKEKLGYKISTGWKSENSFNNERSRDALDMAQASSFVEYEIDDDSKASLAGGISKGSFYQIITNRQPAAGWFFGSNDGTYTYLKGNYDRGGFSSQAFWNYTKALVQSSKLYIEAEINTLEGEIRYNFDLTEKHNITLGSGGRYDYAESNLFPGSDNKNHQQGIWDVFFQDDYKVSDQFKLNGSLRLDHYGLTGDNPSARFAAMYYPNDNDVYRASVGYSFRSPTLSEEYINLIVDVTGTGVTSTTRGFKELEPERYLTYELSYQGNKMEGKFRPFVDLFITRINDFITVYNTGGGPFTLDRFYKNFGDAWSAGGEAGGEYDVNKNFTLLSNIAVNNVDYDDSEVFISPRLKSNAGFKLHFLENRLNTKLLAHYVSTARTTYSDPVKVPAYVYGSLSVGYKIREDLEFSVAGYNIFFDKHIEQVGGDDIGTRILGNLTVKF